MAEPLEGMDAYYAGLHDGRLAEKRMRQRTRGRIVRVKDAEHILRDELEKLWQGRIERGELPPLLPEPIEKAS